MLAIEKREFIMNEVLTTPEAIEFLKISRSRLSSLIKSGKIKPVKKLGCVSLFLKEDLVKRKEDMIKLRQKYGPYEN